MSRRVSRRKHPAAELNITAFMNLMVVLVPFLLISAVFTQITILDLKLPKPGSQNENQPNKLPFELRITGPAEADLGTLRRLAEEGMAILEKSPYARHVRTDMRQPVQKVVADYDEERARWSVVSRADIAESTLRVKFVANTPGMIAVTRTGSSSSSARKEELMQ